MRRTNMFLTKALRDNIFSDLNGVLDNDFFINTNELQKPFNYKINSDDDGVTLSAELPGYNKDMIDVTIEGDSLVIKANPNTDDTRGFSRKFTLNNKMDSNSTEALISDGILTINIQFKEEEKPKKIKVK